MGINGGWLLAVVATQNVTILVGALLYVILIALIFFRFMFIGRFTTTLAPPYWINMGAAITTLA